MRVGCQREMPELRSASDHFHTMSDAAMHLNVLQHRLAANTEDPQAMRCVLDSCVSEHAARVVCGAAAVQRAIERGFAAAASAAAATSRTGERTMIERRIAQNVQPTPAARRTASVLAGEHNRLVLCTEDIEPSAAFNDDRHAGRSLDDRAGADVELRTGGNPQRA